MLEFVHAFYFILTLSLLMDLIPPGTSGLFDNLVILGAASDSFLGPFPAKMLGFIPQFVIAGSFFFRAFFVLRIFA